MNLADFLRQGPLAQQRMADASAFDRDSELANMMRQHGTVSQQPSALDRSGNIASNLFYGDTVPPKDESILDPQYIPMKGAPQKYDGVGMDLVMPAITAWHGSPHKFTKFDMSKIGTGEGAQAYGHGIYAAENPKVATDYQKALSQGETTIAGKTYADDGTGYTLEGVLNSYKGDVGKAQKRANSMMEYYQKNIDKYAGQTDPHALGVIDSAGRSRSEWEALNNQLSDLAGKPMDFQKGNLYKVDIPDDQIAKMLDWDKPLSRQKKHIQDLVKSEHPEQWSLGIKMDKIRNNLKEMADKYGKSGESYKEAIGHAPKKVQKEYQNLLDEFRQAELSMREVKIRTPQMPSSGESIYHSIGAKFGNPNQSMGGLLDAPRASEFLKSKGIPGIKYLDGGSRSGGQGTSNFVLFADDIAKILERNDQPIGELAEMLSSGKKVKP